MSKGLTWKTHHSVQRKTRVVSFSFLALCFCTFEACSSHFNAQGSSIYLETPRPQRQVGAKQDQRSIGTDVPFLPLYLEYHLVRYSNGIEGSCFLYSESVNIFRSKSNQRQFEIRFGNAKILSTMMTVQRERFSIPNLLHLAKYCWSTYFHPSSDILRLV